MMTEKGKPQAISAFVVCLMLFSLSAEAWSATIYSWGFDGLDQVADTPNGTGFTAIAGGENHSLALSGGGPVVVPLPASVWMGLALLGGTGVVGVMRRRMRSA